MNGAWMWYAPTTAPWSVLWCAPTSRGGLQSLARHTLVCPLERAAARPLARRAVVRAGGRAAFPACRSRASLGVGCGPGPRTCSGSRWGRPRPWNTARRAGAPLGMGCDTGLACGGAPQWVVRCPCAALLGGHPPHRMLHRQMTSLTQFLRRAMPRNITCSATLERTWTRVMTTGSLLGTQRTNNIRLVTNKMRLVAHPTNKRRPRFSSLLFVAEGRGLHRISA